MSFEFAHFNFNVANLENSKRFYEKALGLKEIRRMTGNGFTLVYLGDGRTAFELELTELQNHPQKYDLGEGEFHLAVYLDDYDAAFRKHSEMGCVCFENREMGVYFIEDPDGYWIEILPKKCRLIRDGESESFKADSDSGWCGRCQW